MLFTSPEPLQSEGSFRSGAKPVAPVPGVQGSVITEPGISRPVQAPAFRQQQPAAALWLRLQPLLPSGC